MAQSNPDSEKTSIEEAVGRLVEVDKSNASKIRRLESQIDEICHNFTEYKEQNKRSNEEAFQNMTERIQAIQSANTTFQQDVNIKFEEIKLNWSQMYSDMKNDMNSILLKLSETSAPPISTVKMMPKYEAETEEEERKQDTNRKDTPVTLNSTSERPFQTTTSTNNFIPTQMFQISPSLTPARLDQRMNIPSAPPFNPVKHSIIVPPASEAPAFYGKNHESPTQFLIRVQEYAESVHSWDRTTLVNGISQFLRDSALEWYCQLRLSHRRPNKWTEFEDLFLAQFNSLVRKARQEQEWHECKQKENETINEFLVRLRALWREQKPKETEADLVKHLF
jgi:hypothetical protein